MLFDKKELIKSPMNFTGGKFKLLPQILPLFPDKINTFVDLFCGGCNVGINVKADKVICNDYSKQIVDLYKSWKNSTVDDVYNHINNRILQFNLSMQNKDGYIAMRDLYNLERNPMDLYVLICYSFNNSIRFNSKGEFNIAFGKDRSEFNPALQIRLKIFLEKLNNVLFINKSFEDVKYENLKSCDFLYADPPYLITVANYNENGGWNEELEIKLLQKLDYVNSIGVKFALSNVLTHKGKSNDILIEWSKKYNIHHLNTSYSNCNYQTKDKVSKSDEVLITNY